MSGVPCFRGTRLAVQQLFDWLSDGVPLDEFLRDFEIDPRAADAVMRADAAGVGAAVRKEFELRVPRLNPTSDEGVFLDPLRGRLRNRAPHHHRGGNRPKALLRRRHGPRRGLNERRAAERWAPIPQHSADGAPCIAQPRPWMPFSRLPRHPAPARATRSGAGRRAGRPPSTDNLVLLYPTHHRLVHEGGVDVQRLDDGAVRFTNPYGVAAQPPRRCTTSSPRDHRRPEFIARSRHRLRGLHPHKGTRGAGRTLAPRAHLLRPCAACPRVRLSGVATASRDSGDTRPEAGPSARDWNPSCVRVGDFPDSPRLVACRHDRGTGIPRGRMVTTVPDVRPTARFEMRAHLDGADKQDCGTLAESVRMERRPATVCIDRRIARRRGAARFPSEIHACPTCRRSGPLSSEWVEQSIDLGEDSDTIVRTGRLLRFAGRVASVSDDAKAPCLG